MITKFQILYAKGTAALTIIALVVLSGCVGPTRPSETPKTSPAKAGPASETIKLDYLSAVFPEEKVLSADWARVMTAIESTSKDLKLQASGKTEWQDGRAFPLYVGDGGEVAVLMQCIRRTPEQTWVQLSFFEGPEKDRQGRPIRRNLPRGSALCDTFWAALQRYLK